MPEPSQEFNHTPSSSNRELLGKNAVVTGATSGIGLAIAFELASAGANVLIHGRNQEKAESARQSLSQFDVESTCLLADFSNANEIEPFATAAWQWRQRVDIWVNNAGADVLTGPAANASFDEKLDRLWRTDVLATIHLSRYVGGKMMAVSNLDSEPPSILNMSWDQAAIGMEGDSGEMFGAIKGAIAAFSLSLAKSLAPKVRVNCLAPGWIQTKWGDDASDYWQQRAVHESLMSRWGKPEDVACTARFLCSPAAAFINAQVVPINGGLRVNGTTAMKDKTSSE